jgi:hypothetical protein
MAMRTSIFMRASHIYERGSAARVSAATSAANLHKGDNAFTNSAQPTAP